MYDLNQAETGSVYDLLPDGTVARAVLVLQQGGHGEGGWCKLSKGGDQMLDCKWVISAGKHAKRHVFDNMMVSGNEKAVAITMKSLRALIEGHFGIDPNDMSEAACAARRIPSLGAINGLEGCILIGIEKGTDGHPDKNRVKAVIAPGAGNYLAPGQVQANPPAATITAPPAGYGQTTQASQPATYGYNGQPGQPPAYGQANTYGAAAAQPPVANGAKPAWAQ